MYDEELLERNLHPRFRGKIAGVSEIRLVNASCGDEILVFLKVSDGKIVDAKWVGKGCAISTSSADFFAESVIGKTAEEAASMREEFSKMILGEKYSEKRLSAAKKMECVSRMPARANCAKLAWKSLDSI